ncbi:ribosomal-protein-alanine N-acetyltransferase [Bacillus ectoiniformans]|uniref:GNAT family N-acetyltransferase n=1 Tax=Bacillus ectoiniformans TaxID=1494429 RepID=UPI001EF77348|nr:ribosomal-protein-alanine N-acetyltransferase [Bacillus ectoiniformans]
MKVETDRLIVIPCSEETIKMAIQQNYEMGPHIRNHLQQLQDDPSLLLWGVWLVVRKEDQAVIGDIGFKGRPDEERIVETGYGFLEEHWNKGYATEAVEGLVQWAFQTSNVDKVIAETAFDNYGSLRVLEKLNFKKVKEQESMIYWEIKKSNDS